MSYVSSGSYLIYEGTDIVHFAPVVSKGGGAVPYGFKESHPAACDLVLQSYSVFKRLKAIHHPVVGILGKSPEYGVAGMHMAIYETRQYCMMAEFDHLISLILPFFLRSHKSKYFPAIYDHGSPGHVTYALSFHRKEVGCFYDHVNFFHVTPVLSSATLLSRSIRRS